MLDDALHALVSPYMRAPEWIRTAVGPLYRGLPARLKFGRRYGDFARDAAIGPTAVRGDAVAERLRQTIQVALEHVPAYRSWRALKSHLRDPFRALRELPLVSKLDIKHARAQYLSAAAAPARRLAMFTGGSTTHPMMFYLERGVSRPKETAYTDFINRRFLGVQQGAWILSLRGRTAPGATRPDMRLWTREPIKRHLILSSDHLERRFLPEYVRILEAHRPTAVHAFPSALYPLARWLLRQPPASFLADVTGVLLTSENVYPFQSELFRRLFGDRVFLHYGHSERVLLAVSLPGDPRYHFWPLYGLPELVDRDGNVIEEPGVLGEIVGTSFDNHVMPFIRYRTGDLGMWDEVPELRGVVRLVMRRIEGRLQEFVVCRDGRLVSITTLGAAHFPQLADVDAIQFEQRAAGRLTLKLFGTAALSDSARSAIARAVRDKTQQGCDVEVQVADRPVRTPRGKQPLLIQHLDLAPYFGAAVTPQVQAALVAGTEQFADRTYAHS